MDGAWQSAKDPPITQRCGRGWGIRLQRKATRAVSQNILDEPIPKTIKEQPLKLLPSRPLPHCGSVSLKNMLGCCKSLTHYML